jgi:uncharacterized membrane protein YkvA (DUF1232 family)
MPPNKGLLPTSGCAARTHPQQKPRSLGVTMSTTMSLIARLKTRARQLKAEVLALYLAARHSRIPWHAKIFIVVIVAYALSPIDLIPDFIPVLGFLDEIVLLPFAIDFAVKMVPVSVMSE